MGRVGAPKEGAPFRVSDDEDVVFQYRQVGDALDRQDIPIAEVEDRISVHNACECGDDLSGCERARAGPEGIVETELIFIIGEVGDGVSVVSEEEEELVRA